MINENTLPLLSALLEKNKGKNVLLEHEIKEFLKLIGFSVPNAKFIKKGDAISLGDLKFPVAAKISSRTIKSKSDAKGVRLGLRDLNEAKEAFDELIQIVGAEGVLIEEMAQKGLEVIVGGIIDRQFGPVVMFGLGGVFVELFKDVAFGLAPIKKDDALRLIKQIKGYRLLEGYRGNPPVNFDALINIIVSVSEIIAANLIKEIDLNPVALYPDGAMILDAKIEII